MHCNELLRIGEKAKGERVESEPRILLQEKEVEREQEADFGLLELRIARCPRN